MALAIAAAIPARANRGRLGRRDIFPVLSVLAPGRACTARGSPENTSPSVKAVAQSGRNGYRLIESVTISYCPGNLVFDPIARTLHPIAAATGSSDGVWPNLYVKPARVST
jgi:hypothetical protein